MKNQVLVKRYSQGLIKAVRDDAEFAAFSRELNGFYQLLQENSRLQALFMRPFLPASRKKSIAESIFQQIGAEKKFISFIMLLIENDRLDLLPDIVENLPDIWNEEKGVKTFEVSSVVHLSEDQKQKLQERLERLEAGPVALKYRIDPGLIGGLRLRKGNIVYDVSIQGDLEKIQEHIIEG